MWHYGYGEFVCENFDLVDMICYVAEMDLFRIEKSVTDMNVIELVCENLD